MSKTTEKDTPDTVSLAPKKSGSKVTAEGEKHIIEVQYLENWSSYVLPNAEGAKFGKAHPDDAGYDLYHAGPRITIPGGQTKMLNTGIKLNIPKGYYGKIMDRSSIASKTPFLTRGGVIDSGYRGEIKVLIHNLEINPTPITPGQKFAQLVIMPIVNAETQTVTELEETDRAEKGFGSSGS